MLSDIVVVDLTRALAGPHAAMMLGDLGARLAALVKDHIGVTAAVEVLAPNALERSLGKAKRIADRR